LAFSRLSGSSASGFLADPESGLAGFSGWRQFDESVSAEIEGQNFRVKHKLKIMYSCS
jgi:hypothetical protein